MWFFVSCKFKLAEVTLITEEVKTMLEQKRMSTVMLKRDARPVLFNLGDATPVGVVCHFSGSRELLINIFTITFIFYISYMELLFVVAKIKGSPGKND